MKEAFSKRLIYTVKKPRLWILTLLYIVVAIFFENRPDEMLLYLLPEGIAIMFLGMLYEIVVAKSISKAVGRFFVYIILLGLTAFLLMFPLSFILFLNSSQLPELNLFYSERADIIYTYLSKYDSLWELLLNSKAIFGYTFLLIFGGAVSSFLPNRIKEGSIFNGSGHVPFELKYICFMALGFVIGLLPAFLIGFLINGSFPFVLIIVMKLYTETMLTNGQKTQNENTQLATTKNKQH